MDLSAAGITYFGIRQSP